jgi:pimeloyl-ACP methyl ester carboxylesterase
VHPTVEQAISATRPCQLFAVRLALATVIALGLAGCAYRIDRHDLFPYEASGAGPHPAAPAGSDWAVAPLGGTLDGRPLDAWLARRPGSTGLLLFFNGNGYGAARALEVLLPRVATLRLDVVAFNYRLEGEEPPTIERIRRATRAVRACVGALQDPPSGPVLVAGHSLGAWFALDLAADPTLAGVLIMGAGTTPAEVGARLAGAPMRWLFRIEQDDDARLLDAPALAAAVKVPALVIGSRADTLMPPEFEERIAAAIPAAAGKRLVIFEDVAHSGYLQEGRVWDEVAAFFGLPLVR